MVSQNDSCTSAIHDFVGFDDTYEFVLDLYQNGYSLDKNEDGSLPVISRNAALWIADSSEICTTFAIKNTNSELLLTGDGGDEFFYGYKIMKRADFIKNKSFKVFLERYLKDLAIRDIKVYKWLTRNHSMEETLLRIPCADGCTAA